MSSNVFIGVLNPFIGGIAVLLAFLVSIIYQIVRYKFEFYTFGEKLIDNNDKSDIKNQEKRFSITRVPLFLLIIFTLIFSGNILDGLTEGKEYSMLNLLFFSGLTISYYYGMTKFIKTPSLKPVLIIIIVQLVMGVIFKYSPKAPLTGSFMFNAYTILILIWLLLGFLYIKTRKNSS